MKNKQPSNFATAVYIANTHSNNMSDEDIIAVARKLGMYPKVLLKNYKSVVSINRIISDIT